MYTKFKTRYVKELPFVKRSYSQGVPVPFLANMVYKRVRVRPLGGASPYKTLFVGSEHSTVFIFVQVAKH